MVELYHNYYVIYILITFNSVEILREVEDNDSRDDHEQTVVEHQTILTEVFTIKFLFDNDTIASCGQIVQ